MINVADEYGEILKDVSDEFQIASTWFSTSWHWPSPLAQEGCLDSKSIVQDQANSPLKSFLGFLLLLCTLMVKDHTNKQSTQTKYITQYGPNGQSEN